MAGCFPSMAQPRQEVPAMMSIALEFFRPSCSFSIRRRRRTPQLPPVTLGRQALMTAQRRATPYLPLSLADLYFLELTAVPTTPWPPVAARPEQLGAK